MLNALGLDPRETKCHCGASFPFIAALDKPSHLDESHKVCTSMVVPERVSHFGKRGKGQGFKWSAYLNSWSVQDTTIWLYNNSVYQYRNWKLTQERREGQCHRGLSGTPVAELKMSDRLTILAP